MNNQLRAKFARIALIVNTGDPDEVTADAESAVVDLLGNLKHFCQQRKIDFDDCLRIADNHFQTETTSKDRRSP